ncbi:MAG TPA: YceD family protein, partial [Actinomycetes bacterium]|nr:YceD family protein [Actinomycetes bacterium]
EIVIAMSKHVTAPALAVDVRELLQKPGAHKHVVLRAPLDDLATPVASVPPDRPVTVDAEVESVVEGLLVTGKVSATAVVQCVRCLRDLDHDLEVEVRELFALRLRDGEDEGYAVLPDDRLPLDTMARDAIVLGFPAFPLCRPDCAGLCPVCGADRNSVECGHSGPEIIDPRWAGLADLRTGSQEEDDASPQA